MYGNLSYFIKTICTFGSAIFDGNLLRLVITMFLVHEFVVRKTLYASSLFDYMGSLFLRNYGKFLPEAFLLSVVKPAPKYCWIYEIGASNGV